MAVTREQRDWALTIVDTYVPSDRSRHDLAVRLTVADELLAWIAPLPEVDSARLTALFPRFKSFSAVNDMRAAVETLDAWLGCPNPGDGA
jgi:hypothetical protein